MYTPVNFVMKILPYSLWVAYDIKNREEISKMLPFGMKLANVKIYKNELFTSPKLLFNSYSIDSRFMKGKRCEILTVAESKNGKHFIILDCLTNTLDWNPEYGVKPANSCNYIFSKHNDPLIKHKVFSYRGKTLCVEGMRRRFRKISKEFVVEQNKECYYRNYPTRLVLDFDENVVSKDVVQLHKIKIENNFWNKYRGKLTHCFLHDQSMDYNVSFEDEWLF